jgi:RNA polymerase sigma-70 factor (ECF subfamily)
VGAQGSDAEVISRSLADPEEFAAIFDRHFARVHRFFAWRAGREVADDLAGEVFRVAFERRSDYDVVRGDCRPWLYGIALNLLRRHQRSQGRHVRAMERASAPPPTDGFVDEVVARVDATAMALELAATLQRLTEGERDVLLLVAWEGLTYDEVADALGVPLGTVRSRLHRGRRKVREQIAVDGEEQGDRDLRRVRRRGS